MTCMLGSGWLTGAISQIDLDIAQNEGFNYYLGLKTKLYDIVSAHLPIEK